MTKDKNGTPGRIVLKMIVLIIIISGIVLAVLFAFQGEPVAESFKWQQIDLMKLFDGLKEEHSGITNSTFELGNANIVMTDVYMGNLVVLTDSDIRLLNSKGEELWYFTHEIRQPVMHANGHWILVYEQTGKSFMAMRDGKVLLRDTLEETIAFGEISEKNILFISANDTGYKRTVYSISAENGIQQAALYIDDYYPFFAKTVEKEGNQSFILYGLGMNSNRISTIIRLYSNNFESSPITSMELDGLYPLLLDNECRKLFTGEKSAVCYNQSLDLLWSKGFDERILAAELFDDNTTVFALENSLIFYSDAGKEILNIPLDSSVDRIQVYKNIAAVITGNQVIFYNSSGKMVDEANLTGMTLQVHFVDEKKAFLVSEQEAVMYGIARK